MFAETGVGLDTPAVQALLEWLLSMYNEKKGVFKYDGKPISKYSAKTDGVSPRVMKYRAYHLLENDWLTYYGTRIGKALLTQKETTGAAIAE
jgi:hypothetical protein